MDTQHSPVIEKALAITEKYIAKWGKAMIEVYQFPEVERGKFVLFLDALRTALFRNGFLPCYLWIHSKTNVYYLVLWIDGYSRSDMNGILPVIAHLWPLYSLYSFQQLETIQVNATNYQELKHWFQALDRERVDCSAVPHQRSFGATHLR